MNSNLQPRLGSDGIHKQGPPPLPAPKPEKSADFAHRRENSSRPGTAAASPPSPTLLALQSTRPRGGVVVGGTRAYELEFTNYWGKNLDTGPTFE